MNNDKLKVVVKADISQITRKLAARFDIPAKFTIPTILNHLKQKQDKKAE